jgi:hypothetical protein
MNWKGFRREAVVIQSRYYLSSFLGRAEKDNERLKLQ